MNIYVGNLSREATEADLKQAFEAFGKVDTAAIIKDKVSGESKGFGFVENAGSCRSAGSDDRTKRQRFKRTAPMTVNESKAPHRK